MQICKKKDNDAIERVQRRATRLLPEILHLSYVDRLKELKPPTLKESNNDQTMYNLATLADYQCYYSGEFHKLQIYCFRQKMKVRF